MKALPPGSAAASAAGLAGVTAPAAKALRMADLGPLWAEGQVGTVFATLDGAPVAVVPLDVYRRLVSAAASVTRPTSAPGAIQRRAVRPSTIDRKPEVAAFLRERFGQHMTLNALHEACVERFGHPRAPSRTRIAKLRDRSR